MFQKSNPLNSIFTIKNTINFILRCLIAILLVASIGFLTSCRDKQSEYQVIVKYEAEKVFYFTNQEDADYFIRSQISNDFVKQNNSLTVRNLNVLQTTVIEPEILVLEKFENQTP